MLQNSPKGQEKSTAATLSSITAGEESSLAPCTSTCCPPSTGLLSTAWLCSVLPGCDTHIFLLKTAPLLEKSPQFLMLNYILSCCPVSNISLSHIFLSFCVIAGAKPYTFNAKRKKIFLLKKVLVLRSSGGLGLSFQPVGTAQREAGVVASSSACAIHFAFLLWAER